MFSYGDVVYANLDPSVGHEQTKRRPLIVVSNNRFNKRSNQTFVCPVTTVNTGYPLHIEIGPQRMDNGEFISGYAAVEQVKSLDLEAREAVKIGSLPNDEVLARIGDVLIACLLREDRMLLPMHY